MNSKTLLLTNYRANNFVAVGVKPIFNITDRLNLRAEFYFYMPFNKIIKEEMPQDVYAPLYSERFTYYYYMASTALIYNTRLGPLGLSINYLDDDSENWYFMFHLGFMMFNKKGLDY
jgi:NTE family protein